MVVFLKRTFSTIRLSTWITIALLLLLICLFVVVQNIGYKWRPIHEMLICLYIGFCGIVILLRRQLDLFVFRVEGKLAVKIGFALILLSFFSIVVIISL